MKKKDKKKNNVRLCGDNGGAKSKRTGKPCRARAMNGCKRCYHHGALSPKGVDASNFKHGRRSKHLPKRLVERYEEALKDRELMSLQSDVALVEVRVEEICQQLESKAPDWNKAADLYDDLDAAIKSKDAKLMAKAHRALGAEIKSNQSDRFVWNDLLMLLDSRRKLVESERRHLIALGQVVQIERVLAMITGIKFIHKELIHDNRLRSSINERIRRLVESDRGMESVGRGEPSLN